MSKRPTISSARILVLAVVAIAVAIVAIESGGGSSSEKSRASHGYVVPSSDPIAAEKSTPSIPKPSWPGPDSGAPTGKGGAEKVGIEPTGTAGLAQPCQLVSRGEAASILEGAVDVSEGLQGPTCIYSSQDSARQVAVVVEEASFSNLRKRPDKASRVQVGDRTGWCLRYGSSSVEVPLSEGRVLDVSGPCAAATRFAALALDRVQS